MKNQARNALRIPIRQAQYRLSTNGSLGKFLVLPLFLRQENTLGNGGQLELTVNH